VSADWVALILATLTATALIIVPGLITLRGIGLRGLAAAAFAPVASVAMVGMAAAVLGAAGIAWSIPSLGIVITIMAALAWGVGVALRLRPAQPRPQRRSALLPVGIAIGAALTAWRLLAYIQDPAGISQTNDAVFHMNAIRYVLDTANASSLNVSGMLDATGFYPAAWHAVVSALVLGTGSEIPIAANAFTLVIGAVIWVLGITWLTELLTGSRKIAAYAAILSSALQLFPLLMFQWGVLFPNALSVALVPAAVAAGIHALRELRTHRSAGDVLRAVLLPLVAVAALALAQPASLPIWGLVVVLWFTEWMLHGRPARRRGLNIALVVVAWIVLVAVWMLLSRSTGGSHWPPFRGKAEVFLDIFVNGQVRIAPAWAISALMLVGIVVLCRRAGSRWMVGAWLGLSALYVLVAAIGMPLVRDDILGAWYADPNRIAAYAPIAVIPLAAIGLDRVITFLAERFGTSERMSAWVGAAVATVAMVLIIVLRAVPMPAFIEGTFDKDPRYLTTDESYLSIDERALLEALPEYVEGDARVIGNPSTGTGFGYMLSGLDVFPRTWSPPRTPAWQAVAGHLRDVGTDADVCPALAELGDPEYVLDFGDGDNTPGRYEMPGMTDFDGEPGFDLVAERGAAELWRITACD